MYRLVVNNVIIILEKLSKNCPDCFTKNLKIAKLKITIEEANTNFESFLIYTNNLKDILRDKSSELANQESVNHGMEYVVGEMKKRLELLQEKYDHMEKENSNLLTANIQMHAKQEALKNKFNLIFAKIEKFSNATGTVFERLLLGIL